MSSDIQIKGMKEQVKNLKTEMNDLNNSIKQKSDHLKKISDEVLAKELKLHELEYFKLNEKLRKSK